MKKIFLSFLLSYSQALPLQAIEAPTAVPETTQLMANSAANEEVRKLLTLRIKDLNLLRETIRELKTTLKDVTTVDDSSNAIESGLAISSLGGHFGAAIQVLTGDAATAFHWRYLSNFLALMTATFSSWNAGKHNIDPIKLSTDQLLFAIYKLKRETSDPTTIEAYNTLSDGLGRYKSTLALAETNVDANNTYSIIWAANAFTLGKSNFLFNIVSLSAFIFTWKNLATNLNRPQRVTLKRQLDSLERKLTPTIESLNRTLTQYN